MQRLLVLLLLTLCTKAGAQSSALAIADSLYAVGDYAKALEKYQRMPYEKDAKILQKMAKTYQSQGNRDRALEFYAAAVTRNPGLTIALNDYGKLLIAKGRVEKADSIYSDLIERFPENPNFYYQKGRAQMRLAPRDSTATAANYLGAQGAFAKAVQLDSTHQKAIYQLAKFHLQLRDYPLTEKLCKKALESAPENVEIIGLLAQNFYNRGFHRDAIPWFEKLLELGQNTAFIHEKLGYSYYKSGFYKLAIAQYNILLAMDDEDFHLHHTLAKLYNAVEDYKKAEHHGKQALFFKDLPLDDTHFTLGTTFQRSKQFKEAIVHFKRALDENPGHQGASYALAVSADNYYEDKTIALRLYGEYLSKFEMDFHPHSKLSKERISMLKEELFMEGGKQ